MRIIQDIVWHDLPGELGKYFHEEYNDGKCCIPDDGKFRELHLGERPLEINGKDGMVHYCKPGQRVIEDRNHNLFVRE